MNKKNWCNTCINFWISDSQGFPSDCFVCKPENPCIEPAYYTDVRVKPERPIKPNFIQLFRVIFHFKSNKFAKKYSPFRLSACLRVTIATYRLQKAIYKELSIPAYKQMLELHAKALKNYEFTQQGLTIIKEA